MLGRALALAAWAGVIGCGSDARERPPPRDVGALSTPWSTPGPARARRDKELAPLMELVARRRGLAFLEPPELEPLSRAELVRRALRWIDAQTPPALRGADAELLLRLELVPRGFSRAAALAELLARRLQAFYDPASRRILIDRALPLGARRRVLAHELVHALVDQRHALGAQLSGPGSADRRAALLTLAEGDADAVVTQLWGTVPEAPGLADAAWSETEPALPEVLTRALSAPYADGQRVVRRLLEAGGFAAVDALYRDPPDGTHQLLDPEFPASLATSPPELPAPTPPDPSWTLAFSDVLGEQTWRTVLEQWLPPERAAELAGGWRGDRLAAFQRGTRRVLVWEVRSDAERATPVAQAVSHALSVSPARGHHTPRASALSCRPHRDAGVVGQWRHECSLFLVSLLDAAQTVQCAQLVPWTIPASPR